MTKEKIKEVPKFGAKDQFGYMMGDFGCNMSFQLITSYLMLFVTQGLGLSMAAWGILIIIAKVFDAINDPIIGALVDSRKPGKNGKYKPWIFWGAFAIAASTALLFLYSGVSTFSAAGKFAYVLVMYMVWSVSYTAANVPYGSLNAALTDKQNERASLSALRNIGAGLAMCPVLFLVPKLCYAEQGDKIVMLPEKFFWLALIFGIIGIGGFLCTIFLCRERRITIEQPEKPKFNYFTTLKNFFKNRAVVALSLASIAQIVFIQSYAMLITNVFQFFFKDQTLMSLGNILAMAGMMIFIPFMGKLSGRFGKKEICTWPNILSIVVLIIMLFVPFPQTTAGAWIYMVLYMLAMIGGGTFFLATWGMVADCVDEQEVETGTREEASVYATYSLSRKIAQGIAGALVAQCLTWVGFKSDGFASNAEMVEYNSQIGIATGVLNVSIILPLVGFILVFITLLFMYNLNKKKVNYNTEFLRAKVDQYEIDSETPAKCFYDEALEDNTTEEDSQKDEAPEEKSTE